MSCFLINYKSVFQPNKPNLMSLIHIKCIKVLKKTQTKHIDRRMNLMSISDVVKSRMSRKFKCVVVKSRMSCKFNLSWSKAE